MRTIALLTDFGLADPYAGQVKGVLTTLAPQIPVIDITHEVEPFQIGQAAFFLAASVQHFPQRTIFVCVVDPGVGTHRRIVLVRDGDSLFLAPDNGLLGLVLHGKDFDAWDVSDRAGRHSDTFHGRDVFAPMAAELATGATPGSLGSRVEPESLVRFEESTPTELSYEQAGRMVQAQVLHIDRFGNVVVSMLPGSLYTDLATSGHAPQSGPRMVRAYGELNQGELGLLLGSQGFMELAVNRGSAAETLDMHIGDVLTLGMPEMAAPAAADVAMDTDAP